MNRRTKTVALASVLIVALSLVAGSLYLVAAESDQDDAAVFNPLRRIGGWRMRGPMLGFLDEEQRQELMGAIEAMRDEGAAPDEIRAYIRECLEGLGVECPEPRAAKPQLTDEQLEGLGRLRAEVEELIRQRLEELGIDKPFMGRLPGLGSRGGKSFMGRLPGLGPRGGVCPDKDGS